MPAKQLPRFVAVIHVQDDEQALKQSRIALLNGAGGVMLIDHRRHCNQLIRTYNMVRQYEPEAWIGINFLDLNFCTAVSKRPHDADALWVDAVEGGEPLAQKVRMMGAGKEWRLFAGTAFKHQPVSVPLEEETRLNAQLYDIVCTSGVATGSAPDVEKLVVMRNILGNRPLALASGVRASNAASFARYVDCFLVATGISQDFHTLDAFKVRELADIIDARPHPLHTLLVENP